jgi:hypothetical protein
MWKKKENWIFVFAAIGAVAALVTILQYFHITPGTSGETPPPNAGGPVPVPPVNHATLLLALVAFAFSIGMSIYGLYLSNLRKKQMSGPLVIRSAKWGIGGDAFKDVTDIVRAHAKPDSINLPASIGVFGDPYEGNPKRLRVRYSFARIHEIEVWEGKGNSLVLPEQEGQEQDRVETEKAKARLAAITRGADDPRRTPLEARAYRELDNQFKNMNWAQKVAMMLLCDGIAHEQTLAEQMRLMGMGPKDFIMIEVVRGLRASGLVESSANGTLRLNQARLKDVEGIVSNWDFTITPQI